MNSSFVLTLACADRPGIVAAVTNALAKYGGNIIEANQFEDAETGRFFMRVVFTLSADSFDAFFQAFAPVAEGFGMDWELRLLEERPRTLLLASKSDHCLVDLLYRERIGELPMQTVGVVSNHSRETFSDIGGVPFHFLPVSPETKEAQEQRIKAVIIETKADLVILARYMQILSKDLATFLSGRCINIHHSFLPSFKGARPYHQAHARGVKMIGATAHYVTADLDEGPIIAQDVEQISHSDRPAALIRKGRDIERRVLARAVRAHLEMRVLLNGPKTVVFHS